MASQSCTTPSQSVKPQSHILVFMATANVSSVATEDNHSAATGDMSSGHRRHVFCRRRFRTGSGLLGRNPHWFRTGSGLDHAKQTTMTYFEAYFGFPHWFRTTGFYSALVPHSSYFLKTIAQTKHPRTGSVEFGPIVWNLYSRTRSALVRVHVGPRGSPERDISSLGTMGPGPGRFLGGVRPSRAFFFRFPYFS